MSKYRKIPEEDMTYSFRISKLNNEYRDGAYCECGAIIKIKNRQPYETVIIKCPNCGKEILYG